MLTHRVERRSRAPRILAVVAVALASVACGEEEEPPPPMPPQIESGSAVCDTVEQVFYLDTVEFRVFDVDGVDDLLEPVVVVGATRLDMAAETVPWDEATAAEGEACRSEAETPSCEVVYRWERDPLDPMSPRIFCGEDGKLLAPELEVVDTYDYRATARAPSQPK